MHASSYTVEGMTCCHCVNAVTAEVGHVLGVSGVDVDLATGATGARLVTLSSTRRRSGPPSRKPATG